MARQELAKLRAAAVTNQEAAAQIIQRVVRGLLARRVVAAMRAAALHAGRQASAAVCLQAAWRGCQARRRFVAQRGAALLLQAAARGMAARKMAARL